MATRRLPQRPTYKQLESEITELRNRATMNEALAQALNWQSKYGPMIERIEEQVKLTNGRVTALEMWRGQVKALVAAASAIGGAISAIVGSVIR